jgi:multiple sugar transport system substrate-binding protein
MKDNQMADTNQPQKGLSRREFLIASSATAAGMMLTGGLGIAHSASKKQIKFITHEAGPTELKIFDKQLKEFLSNHPGVEINPEFLGFDAFKARIPQIIAAGEAPEVVNASDDDVAKWVSQDLLMPVTDVVEAIGDIPNSARIIVDGEDYFVPYILKFLYSFYREDLFEKEKIDPPVSWYDYLQAARKLTKGNQKGCIVCVNPGSAYTQFAFQSHAWSNGTKFLEFKDDKWQVCLDIGSNKVSAIETLEWVKEMYKYSVTGTQLSWGGVQKAYATGRAATIEYSARVLEQLRQYNPKLVDASKAMRIPYSKIGRARLLINGYTIFKGSKNPELSKELIKSLITGRNYLNFLWTTPLHLIPPNQKIFEGEWQELPFIRKRKDVIDVIRDTRCEQHSPTFGIHGSRLCIEGGVLHTSPIYAKMLANVVIGGQDPGKAVDAAAKEMRALIASL